MRNSVMDERMQNRVHEKMKTAAEEQDLKTIESLLKEYGCDYFSELFVGQKKETRGLKMLHHAVKEDNFDFVKLLIENGWDVNQQNFFNGNTLFQAITWGAGREIKRYLMRKGVDIHYRSASGKTSLMICIRERDFITGEVLIQSGVGLDKEWRFTGNAIEMLENYVKKNWIEKEDIKRWMDIFHRNKEFLNGESLKILQTKRLQHLF